MKQNIKGMNFATLYSIREEIKRRLKSGRAGCHSTFCLPGWYPKI